MVGGVPEGLKKVAALCILRNGTSFLLLRRSKEPHLGKYIPIGGKLEPYETPSRAACREIQEEANITVDELKLCGIMTETSPTRFNWVNYVYIADVDNFVPSECNEGTLEWVSYDQIDKIATPTTDRFIYEYATKRQFFIFDAIYDEYVELEQLTDELTGAELYRKHFS